MGEVKGREGIMLTQAFLLPTCSNSTENVLALKRVFDPL